MWSNDGKSSTSSAVWTSISWKCGKIRHYATWLKGAEGVLGRQITYKPHVSVAPHPGENTCRQMRQRLRSPSTKYTFPMTSFFDDGVAIFFKMLPCYGSRGNHVVRCA
jgi:hypothetical protein